jgi:hypothetical protein
MALIRRFAAVGSGPHPAAVGGCPSPTAEGEGIMLCLPFPIAIGYPLGAGWLSQTTGMRAIPTQYSFTLCPTCFSSSEAMMCFWISFVPS